VFDRSEISLGGVVVGILSREVLLRSANPKKTHSLILSADNDAGRIVQPCVLSYSLCVHETLKSLLKTLFRMLIMTGISYNGSL